MVEHGGAQHVLGDLALDRRDELPDAGTCASSNTPGDQGQAGVVKAALVV